MVDYDSKWQAYSKNCAVSLLDKFAGVRVLQSNISIYPNPASTHITIDYDNFNAMSSYTLVIANSIGQTVFTAPINQQTSYIDISKWTGNGIYYVQLIDTRNNTIEKRKIVIQ